MQTAGSLSASEREAELRRRNDEIDMRQNEAVRVAQDVVRLQGAKLVLSPGQARSPSRQERSSSAHGGSARVSASSRSSGRFLDEGGGLDDDEDARQLERDMQDLEGEVQYDDQDDELQVRVERASPGGRRSAGASPAAARTSPGEGRAKSANAKRALSMGGGGGEGGVTQQMGSEATIRYLKAKLKVVEEELEESAEDARGLKERLTMAEKHSHELEQAGARAGSAQSALRAKNEKLKSELDERGKLVESLKRQLGSSVKEKEAIEKSHRQTESATGVKDVRLNRALEEVERYKKMMSESKAAAAEQAEAQRRTLDKVMAEKKKLAKQKTELLLGFKKQMRLIDILRRQLVHVQAAKLLSLTEAEFTRALELGETL